MLTICRQRLDWPPGNVPVFDIAAWAAPGLLRADAVGLVGWRLGPAAGPIDPYSAATGHEFRRRDDAWGGGASFIAARLGRFSVDR